MQLLLLVLLLSGAILVSGEVKVVDLTRDLGQKSVYWPDGPPFLFKILFREQLQDYWFELNTFTTSEHTGTHLDSPSHFSKGKWRMHEIPPERLFGPGIVIDVSSKVKSDENYRLSIDDVFEYERKYGNIPEGAIVFMKSGWSERYPDMKRVFNTEEPEDLTSFQYPGFHVKTVSWLLANRKIGMIGIDTPSVDYGISQTFPVHLLTANNEVMNLENVANLDKIPPKGVNIFVGAIKLFEGSGGPVRILATFESNLKENTERKNSEL